MSKRKINGAKLYSYRKIISQEKESTLTYIRE